MTEPRASVTAFLGSLLISQAASRSLGEKETEAPVPAEAPHPHHPFASLPASAEATVVVFHTFPFQTWPGAAFASVGGTKGKTDTWVPVWGSLSAGGGFGQAGKHRACANAWEWK